jgi:membrane protease YdiL (CAAX protease family)
MFIQQAFKSGNSFGKYLLGSLIVFVFAILGQLPLTIAVAVKALTTGRSIPTQNNELYRFFDANVSLLLILISFAVAFGGLVLAVRIIQKQKIKEIVTSRPAINWRRFFFAFAVWGAFSVITTAIAYYTSPESFALQFNIKKFLLLCAIAIPLIPIQTSVEELVFRGYLMQGFGLLAKNRWFPLVMTSLIFGGMHLMNPEVTQMGILVTTYYILTGFLLGIMTLMDEGTELALGFHAANNLFAALLVTSDWSALQTYSVLKDLSEPSAGFDVILPAIIIYPIILFIFAKKYKWHSWKEKLTGNIAVPVTQSNPNPTNPYYEQFKS